MSLFNLLVLLLTAKLNKGDGCIPTNICVGFLSYSGVEEDYSYMYACDDDGNKYIQNYNATNDCSGYLFNTCYTII